MVAGDWKADLRDASGGHILVMTAALPREALDEALRTVDGGKGDILHVECCADSGISFVRGALRDMAGAQTRGVRRSLVLWDADMLTYEAQSALRRQIEVFSTVSRYIMVVESAEGLMAPILSRVVPVRVPSQTRPGCGVRGAHGQLAPPPSSTSSLEYHIAHDSTLPNIRYEPLAVKWCKARRRARCERGLQI